MGRLLSDQTVVRLTWMLAAAAALFVCARITMTPFAYSDPVNSRWLAIEALAEDGQLAVGERVERRGRVHDLGRMAQLPTVDLMMDPETQRFYSSKPPLLQVVYAPVARGIAAAIGAPSMSTARESVMRWLLLLVHGTGFALAIAWLTQEMLRSTRPRVALALVATAALASFLPTFANALGNHFPAALAALVAVAAALRGAAAGDEGRESLFFAVAGGAAGVVASLEYPGLVLVATVLFVFARVDARRAALFALPAALLPIALEWIVNARSFGDPVFFLRRSADWFRYAGSYWNDPGTLDAAKPSRFAYILHFTLGHHGAFLLTPLFGLSLGASLARVRLPGGWGSTAALVAWTTVPALVKHGLNPPEWISLLLLAPLWLVPMYALPRGAERRELAAWMLVACALPVLAFYFGWSSNYGGITSGPRWLLWLTPLWLFALVDPLERLLTRRAGALVFALLFAVSAFSALAPWLSPYTHPWTYRLYQSWLGSP